MNASIHWQIVGQLARMYRRRLWSRARVLRYQESALRRALAAEGAIAPPVRVERVDAIPQHPHYKVPLIWSYISRDAISG